MRLGNWIKSPTKSPTTNLRKLAEVHGNRTHPRAHHPCTGFEDQETHQAPWHFRLNNVLDVYIFVNLLIYRFYNMEGPYT